MQQISDEATPWEIVERVVAGNPKQAEGYRTGKEGLFGFFVGQGHEGDERQGKSGADVRVAA